MSHDQMQAHFLSEETGQRIDDEKPDEIAPSNRFDLVDAYRASPTPDDAHFPNYGSPQPDDHHLEATAIDSKLVGLDPPQTEELKCVTPSFVRDEGEYIDPVRQSIRSPKPDQTENPQNPPAQAHSSANLPKMTEPDDLTEQEKAQLVTLDPQQNVFESQPMPEVTETKISSPEPGNENMSKASRIITTPDSIRGPQPDQSPLPKAVLPAAEQSQQRLELPGRPKTPKQAADGIVSVRSSSSRKHNGHGSNVSIDVQPPLPPPPPPEGSQTVKRPNPRVLQPRNATPSKFVCIPIEKKGKFICLFCGGSSCKQENWKNNPNSVIKGLDSDWITDNVLAMQRPSSRLIQEYGILKQFQEHNITAVFNLEEPGEHPYCGDGIIEATGFSYNPDDLFKSTKEPGLLTPAIDGIAHYNFGWEDHSAPTTAILLKLMKLMHGSISRGEKVAVHCHAGRGRTGVVIAAYIIYSEGISAAEAVKLFQTKRKNSLSNTSQIVCLQEFAKVITEARQLFGKKLTLQGTLESERLLYIQDASIARKHTPMLVRTVLRIFKDRVSQGLATPNVIILACYDIHNSVFKNPWDKEEENALKRLKQQCNSGAFQQLEKVADVRVLAQLLFDFLEGMRGNVLSQASLQTLEAKFPQARKDVNVLFTFPEYLPLTLLPRHEFFTINTICRFFKEMLFHHEQTHLTSEDENLELLLRLCSRLALAIWVTATKGGHAFFYKSLGDLKDSERELQFIIQMLCSWSHFASDALENRYLDAKNPGNLQWKLAMPSHSEPELQASPRAPPSFARLRGKGSQSSISNADQQKYDEILRLVKELTPTRKKVVLNALEKEIVEGSRSKKLF